MRMMVDGGGGAAIPTKPATKAASDTSQPPKKGPALEKPQPSAPKQAAVDAKKGSRPASPKQQPVDVPRPVQVPKSNDADQKPSRKGGDSGPASPPRKGALGGLIPIPIPIPKGPSQAPSGPADSASRLDAATADPAGRKDLADKQKQAEADANKAGQLARRMGEDPKKAHNAVLAEHYKQQPIYVDDATGRAYQAKYDETTGELTGTRTSDTPIELAPTQDRGAQPVVDTTIVVHADGTVTATQTGTVKAKDSDDIDRKRTITTDYGSDRKATGQKTEDTGSAKLEGGGTREYRASSTVDGSGKPTGATSTDKRHRSNGNSYETTTSTTYDAHGKPQRDVTTDTATENGIVAKETHDKTYTTGGEADETVTRSLTGESRVVDPGHPRNLLPWLANDERTVTQTDKVHYNAKGEIDKIASDYPDDETNSLNDILRKQAPDSETVPYFVFGQVESRPSTNDKGELRIGTVGRPAAAIEYRGIQVSIEGADPARDYPNHWSDTSPVNSGHDLPAQDKFNTVRTHIDGLPPQLADNFDHLRYIDENAPGAAAWAYGDNIVFFGGNTYSEDTLFHESAHTAANAKNYDPKQWRDAAEKDRATREAFVANIPEGSRVTGTNKDLLNNNLGVDDYGDGSLDNNGNGGEDWAEATSLYLKSHRDGYIATITKPDGSVQHVTFEDLYPERARILEEHYGKFEGWHPGVADPRNEQSERIPAPTEDAVRGAGQIGIGGGSGSLADSVRKAAEAAGVGGG